MSCGIPASHTLATAVSGSVTSFFCMLLRDARGQCVHDVPREVSAPGIAVHPRELCLERPAGHQL